MARSNHFSTCHRAKATVVRRYLGRDGTWKTSQSFSRNEIPLAIYVLQKAFEAMIGKRPEEVDADAQEVA